MVHAHVAAHGQPGEAAASASAPGLVPAQVEASTAETEGGVMPANEVSRKDWPTYAQLILLKHCIANKQFG